MTKDDKLEKLMEQAKNRYAPLISIFQGQIGQQALELLEEEFIFQPTYVQGDPHHSSYLEGQRALVLWLRDVVANNGEIE